MAIKGTRNFDSGSLWDIIDDYEQVYMEAMTLDKIKQFDSLFENLGLVLSPIWNTHFSREISNLFWIFFAYLIFIVNNILEPTVVSISVSLIFGIIF